MTLEFAGQIFEKSSNIIFYENPSSGSQTVPCRWTDGRTNRRTDMMKLIVTFHNFANAPHRKYPNLLVISFRQELPNNSTAWSFYICIMAVQHFMIENRNHYCRLVCGPHVKKYKFL
jgi:hypothetical protein